MVLTRRAAAAARSIIRWLPNEILAIVMHHLSVAELCKISLVSRLLHNIATPFIYRCLEISNIPQLKMFIRSMNNGTGTLLSLHVREFNPPDNYDALQSCTYTPAIVKDLMTVVSRFSHLETLNLLYTTAINFSELLERASFPRLTSFQYTLHSADCASVISFLRRHSTLKKLTFLENERLNLPGPIHLPHLRELNVPHNHYASFVLDDVPLTSATVMIYDPNFNLEPTWRLLRTIPQLRAVGVICGVQHFDDAAELGKVAAHIPHIEAFSARRPGLNFGPGTLLSSDAEAIAAHLKKLPSLSYLELDSHFDELDLDEIEEEIRRWSDECETLVEVIFNGQKWKWDNEVEDWTFTPREAYIVT
ncbi:hypothetical protein R3P38DRAFT_3108697 [Favolaschia claudopus]|uniref:F-box domain-containing protein n=1 Tax=Favolaschia claudopus TaxID=2862362 RepID=A0AAV9ZJC5_9AGAR